MQTRGRGQERSRGMTSSTVSKTRIVVIGAGYAGLLFTTRLAGKMGARKNHEVQITLVNDAPGFVERIRLHEYAADPAVRWRPISEIIEGTGVSFVQGRVMAINTTQRAISIETGGEARAIGYDYLVYALGSLTDRSAASGVAERAYALAPSGPLSAEALRARLPEVAAAGGRVVVCGGGATGIETAAELATAYPSLRVRLVTDGALGETWGPGVAAYMRHSLTRSKVAIYDQTRVVEARADGVVTSDGQVFLYDLLVWTAGFVARPLAREAGLPVNERDQVVVDPYMRVISHPEIYAVGDAATPREEPGSPVRMSAFTALILGAHGADSLAATLRGKTPTPLSFAYVGQGVALGRHDGIGFNTYPGQMPHRPYFTGRVMFRLRALGCRYLANVARIETRFPGSFAWVGVGRYAAQQRRKRATEADRRDMAQPVSAGSR
jgi:NADH dehydrogenase FAD-containing subunit